MGTLTSPKFRIIGHKLSFLLGGGCDVGKIRVELLGNGQVVQRLLRTNVVKKCEGESGMFDSLKTELLKYVWLMHQGRDIQIIQRMRRQATNLLGD